MTQTKHAETAKRFIKLARIEDNPDIEDLVSLHHNEFILLTIIAMRARRSVERHPINGLEQHQAFLGDYKSYGLTEQQYRTAKSNVHRWGYATFKGTNKGTVATLVGSTVYDINAEPANGQPNGRVTDKVTDAQRTGNGRVTTKKNVRREECKNVRMKEHTAPSAGGDLKRVESSHSKQTELEQILDELCPASRRPILEEWLAYKKELRKSYKPLGLRSFINEWKSYSDEELKFAVNKSMANNWAGCFPNKVSPTTGNFHPVNADNL